jgi:hypothetical protein
VHEEELRQVVRDAIARHLGRGPDADHHAPHVPGPIARSGPGHASHAVFLTLVNDTDNCIIEPAVPCSHCEYCKSHGY